MGSTMGRGRRPHHWMLELGMGGLEILSLQMCQTAHPIFSPLLVPTPQIQLGDRSSGGVL